MDFRASTESLLIEYQIPLCNYTQKTYNLSNFSGYQEDIHNYMKRLLKYSLFPNYVFL